MNSNPYIMIVEDSIDISEILCRLYESEGYNVILAKHGGDAIEKLKTVSKLPCVILLDLMMPVMDGYRFCVEQKKDMRLAEIPVVIMTADANAKEKSVEVGASGYIRKPVEIETLLEVAAKYCRKSA